MGSSTTGSTLAELVADHKGDRSYERLSKDCGGTPTAKRLQQIATNPARTFPDPDTVRGLARGLGVTVTEVVLASARSLGLQVSAGEGDSVSIAGVQAAPEMRAAVLALRNLAEASHQLGAAGASAESAAPSSSASGPVDGSSSGTLPHKGQYGTAARRATRQRTDDVGDGA